MEKRILVIDDDKNLCEIFKTALESKGYVVETAVNGEEGMTKAMNFKPELVLLDIMMPQIHGFHVLDILKATPQTKNIKVLILSALSDPKIISKAKDFGSVGYLVKSDTDMEGIIKTIEKVLGN